MKNTIDVALIGIGGYGAHHLEMVRQLQVAGRVRLSAVIDPLVEKSPHWPGLRAEGVPAFPTLAEFKRAGVPADLAVISSPIAFHAGQSCEAMAMGVNVLCEKPMAATIQDAYRMQAARNAAVKFLEIGYQWSFSGAIQGLKHDILAGRFGAPVRLLTWVGWPRTSAYYGRNTWAGRLCDEAGRWVLDSPVNNATAHYLHNMLFVIGPALNRSATPVTITAECYRANPIENYDAACCRVETQENVDVLFFTAHCVQGEGGPVFRFIFENATVEYKPHGTIIERFTDGHVADYGNPDLDPTRKLIHCVDQCVPGTAAATVCGPEAALAHTLCVNGMQEIPIHDFDPAWIQHQTRASGDTLTFVPGLFDALRQGFEQGRLFSELGLPWACPASRVSLRDYVSFPQSVSTLAPVERSTVADGSAAGGGPTDKPSLRVILVGDSTVADYPLPEPTRGWGQMLPRFLDAGASVVNLAACGRSTKTFIQEKRWEDALHRCRPGDWVLIQFGHNDSHAKDQPESTDAATEYKGYLRRYVDDARCKGARPILVTPMHRRRFDPAGRITQELAPYAEAMQAVAAEKQVLCIDLHRLSGEAMQAMGDAGCADWFCSPADRTHFSEKGALFMARLIAEELQSKQNKGEIRDSIAQSLPVVL